MLDPGRGPPPLDPLDPLPPGLLEPLEPPLLEALVPDPLLPGLPAPELGVLAPGGVRGVPALELPALELLGGVGEDDAGEELPEPGVL